MPERDSTPLYLLGAIVGVLFLAFFTFARAENQTIATQATAGSDLGTFTTFNLDGGISGQLAEVYLALSTTGTPGWTELKILCYGDSGHVSVDTNCTVGAGAGVSTQVRSTVNTSASMQFLVYNFASQNIRLRADRWYSISFYNAQAVGTHVWGATTPNQCQASCNGSPYFVLTGDPFAVFSFGLATTTSLVSAFYPDATSTLTALAGRCAVAGNIFSEGLCTAGVFLFVPDPSTLNALFLTASTAEAHFPFSWVTGVKGVIDTMTASSSQNMTTVSFDFASTNMATSSPMSLPKILPSITAFSTTTILTYVSVSTWALFQSLMALAIWLTFTADVFFTVRNQMHKV